MIETCVQCGYELDADDYPLVDGELCEECHFWQVEMDEAQDRRRLEALEKIQVN